MNKSSSRIPPPPSSPEGALDGVLVVDKPAGPTSHDIVDRARKILGIRKIGHGGTLDPLATGVLVLLIGRGTKLSDYFLGSDKTYEGTITLGVATDSHDAAGDITAETDPSGVTEEAIRNAVRAMVGDQMQTPPQVSAIKIDGVPMYKRARKGVKVEVKPRLIRIYEFTILSIEMPKINVRIRCTKGTYIRKIAADLGDALGCGAHLSRLRRTQSGEFSIADAMTMTEFVEMGQNEIAQRILPVNNFSARRIGVHRPAQ